MNILALGAHPDDIEIGCGGTLLKYTKAGHGVYLMVLTEGAQGGSAKVRRDEQLASCRILGAKEVFWGGYPDTEVPVTRRAIQQIEDIVKKVDPAFIFVNYFDDTHQDHRHLATCTVTASSGEDIRTPRSPLPGGPSSRSRTLSRKSTPRSSSSITLTTPTRTIVTWPPAP